MEKCPICKGNFKLIFDVNYDEPPERLTECQDCGFSEYYFYYEGYTTSVRSCKFDKESQYYEDIELCVINNGKRLIDREEYKSILNEELKKLCLTVEDLISIKKEKAEFVKNQKKMKKEKEINDKLRWENDNHTQEELLEINEFLSQEILKLNELEKEGIVNNLKVQQKEGLITNIVFEINEKRAEKYAEDKSYSQALYALSIGAPMFAPKSCFNCYTRIFELNKENKVIFGKSYEVIKEHLTMEKCSTTLITGCPRCNRSYVD